VLLDMFVSSPSPADTEDSADLRCCASLCITARKTEDLGVGK